MAVALDAHVILDLQWRGVELDRLLDARHAALQEWIAAYLRGLGWEVRAEVSFNEYGDRGRYDLLAFHRLAKVLVIVEVKTSIGDIQELLGKLDVKVRVATSVARRLAWRATASVPIIVLTDSSTSRRHVRRHAELFARFTTDRRLAATCLRSPETVGEMPAGILMFRKLPYAHQGSTTRVRPSRQTQSHTTTAVDAISGVGAG